MSNKRNSLKKIAGFSALASVLPSTWVKPFVSTVVLPAHATTSVCTSRDVVGKWRLEVLDIEDPIDRIIEFLADGTTDNPFIHEWSVSGEGEFKMTQDISDWIFVGTFNSKCSKLTGTYTRNPTYLLGITGMWRATKL